ncbi:hypothetical protein B5S28_g1908 [[Candida] boidinii]|nr:hypothetical protein B5S28_g1908 [[Candida] boidinii]OWB62188.1 hypothetical protein B5S29_g3110 [[Candida] boidinii]
MSVKHPFQEILVSKDETLLFAASKSSIFSYKIDIQTQSVKLLGSWSDDVSPFYTLEKQREAKINKIEAETEDVEVETENKVDGEADKETSEQTETVQNEDSESTEQPKKLQKTNKKKKKKLPKLPTPGAGAPPLYNYIRGIYFSRNEKYLLALTDNDKAVIVFEISPETGLTFIKRQTLAKRPCTLSTSIDDQDIVVGDKFGDVYSLSLTDKTVQEDVSKIEPILGHVSMLTVVSVIERNNKSYVISADRDEHIRISNYPKSYVIDKWLFGHKQFVSAVVAPEWLNDKILISGGGDKFLCSWNWTKPRGSEMLQKFEIHDMITKYLTDEHLTVERFQNEAGDLREYAVSQILCISESKKILVFVENIRAFFIFDLSDEGILSLCQTVELESSIIYATNTLNGDIFLSLKNDKPESSVAILRENSESKLYEISDSSVISKALVDANTVVVESDKDIIPLFNVAQLKKRSEH